MSEYQLFQVEFGERSCFYRGTKTFFSFDVPQVATHLRRWLKSVDSQSFRSRNKIPRGIFVLITIVKNLRSPNQRLVSRQKVGTFGFHI